MFDMLPEILLGTTYAALGILLDVTDDSYFGADSDKSICFLNIRRRRVGGHPCGYCRRCACAPRIE